MAERVIARKTQLFLHSVLPVVDTHAEVVRKKFKRGKFVVTFAGIVKIVALLLILIGLILFLWNTKCADVPDWHPYLFPISSVLMLLICFVIFITFSLGLIVNNPGFWIKMDIIVCIVFPLLSIGCTIASIEACKIPTELQKVPESLNIVGSALLLLNCASVLLMYRYKEDENADTKPPKQAENMHARKSIFA